MSSGNISSRPPGFSTVISPLPPPPLAITPSPSVDASSPPTSASELASPLRARAGTAAMRAVNLGSELARSGSMGGAEEGVEWERDESRIGVKRACNECRQQKLRCNVIQDPYQPCTRCRKIGLDCRIDSNFRRVGKRKRTAQMESDLESLRASNRQLQQDLQEARTAASLSSTLVPGAAVAASLALSSMLPQTLNGMATHAASMMAGVAPFVTQTMPQMPTNLNQYMGSHEAVASLLDLKSGADGTAGASRSANGGIGSARILEDVLLTQERVHELFNVFFTFNHPFVPLLDADRHPDAYYADCPLLFWTILAVAARRFTPLPTLLHSLTLPMSRLLWATVADVPQSYHVVKALCVLCTWPLPISSTSTDPTFMLSGLMMQIAMQIGLHRPSHAQDFSKFKIELREEELRDRVKTWAACNCIAQRVATGYGQPPNTHYDWTLGPLGQREPHFGLPPDADARLRIEMFCNDVTRSLYSNDADPVGLANESGKALLCNFLAKQLQELEDTLEPRISPINTLYLRAAALHFRLSALFDSPSTTSYREEISYLWLSTTAFLDHALALSLSPTDPPHLITHATNYLLQMIIAATFTLLKLLHSFFARLIDIERGRTLFTRAVHIIRSISVTNQDLPSRLAEVLAQLWRSGGSGASAALIPPDSSSLQVKVRCRMSMSLVYDSVWRWREEFQAKGRGNLESALRNPTNLDSTVESSTSSIIDHHLALPSGAAIDGIPRAVTPALDDVGFEDWSNAVFDPLGWMLDGFVEFPCDAGS